MVLWFIFLISRTYIGQEYNKHDVQHIYDNVITILTNIIIYNII